MQQVLKHARLAGLSVAVLIALAGLALAGSPRPGTYTGTLPSRVVREHTMTFYGRAPARVGIVGQRGSNLAVYVLDGNGRLVARSRGGNVHRLSWYPRWTDRFTVCVVNRDYSPTVYALAKN